MLHRSCDDSTIANNEAYQNGDAGAAIFETSNTTIYGNNFFDNRCEQRLLLLLLPAIGRVSPIFTLASGAQKVLLGAKQKKEWTWKRLVGAGSSVTKMSQGGELFFLPSFCFSGPGSERKTPCPQLFLYYHGGP